METVLTPGLTEKILFTYGMGGFFAVIAILYAFYRGKQDSVTIKDLLKSHIEIVGNNTIAMNHISDTLHYQNEAFIRLENEMKNFRYALSHLPGYIQPDSRMDSNPNAGHGHPGEIVSLQPGII